MVNDKMLDSSIFHPQKMANKFVAGDIEVEEFLEQFMTIRKVMHHRKVKVDKMRELRRKCAGYPSAMAGPGYPLATNFPGMGSGLPYPSGQLSMPMPGYRPYWTAGEKSVRNNPTPNFVRKDARVSHRQIGPKYTSRSSVKQRLA